jgi:hypothetical protein
MPINRKLSRFCNPGRGDDPTKHPGVNIVFLDMSKYRIRSLIPKAYISVRRVHFNMLSR